MVVSDQLSELPSVMFKFVLPFQKDIFGQVSLVDSDRKVQVTILRVRLSTPFGSPVAFSLVACFPVYNSACLRVSLFAWCLVNDQPVFGSPSSPVPRQTT